jgi:kumamolisin
MLDIEVVAGVCPKSTIAVYFAHWGERGWVKALDAAVHDTKNNPTVLSQAGAIRKTSPYGASRP